MEFSNPKYYGVSLASPSKYKKKLFPSNALLLEHSFFSCATHRVQLTYNVLFFFNFIILLMNQTQI